jgi:hypothetical protein
MSYKRNTLKLITSYIATITIFFVLSIYFTRLLLIANKYYLFIVIPILFMSITIGFINLIKLILTIISLIFGRNDNEEIPKFINRVIYNVNQIYKYTLIGIFIALITSVMILDIMLCVTFENYFLLTISIVIWILLYYLIFRIIVGVIKKEISL